MRLSATALSPALAAARAQDLAFDLQLVNDEPAPVVVCAKDAPFASLYGLPSWGAQLVPVGARDAAPVVFRLLFNPAWGAPAPPHVPRYLKEHGTRVKPGGAIDVRLQGCWVPREALPDDASLRRLLNHPREAPAPLPAGVRWDSGDYARASLVVMGRSCGELQAALARGADDCLFGLTLAVLPEPGGYELTFWYDEHEAFAFVPARPLRVAAPALRLAIPSPR
jgi:hypothetical protein